jgi:CRP-like cAMP-binding protein
MNNILENAPKIVLNNLIKESYKKNTTILKQGDINEYLYFINKGIVDVWTVSKKGQEISLSTFITGQSIGIFEIFDSKLQTENVVALVDTDIIKIHKDFVLKWMKEDFEFTLYIIKIFQDCFNQASYFSRNLVTLKLKERVMLSLYNHLVLSQRKNYYRKLVLKNEV